MQLIIGGSFQGKSAYALANCEHENPIIADGVSCTQEQTLHCDLLDHLHIYIRRLLKQGIPYENIAEQIKTLWVNNPAILIVCNELGNGIVPMDAFDRTYREAVGRICCYLGTSATKVVRITCGIPLILK